MARKFCDLEAKMTPDRLAQTDALAKKIIAEMNLATIRQSRGLSQSGIRQNKHSTALAEAFPDTSAAAS